MDVRYRALNHRTATPARLNPKPGRGRICSSRQPHQLVLKDYNREEMAERVGFSPNHLETKESRACGPPYLWRVYQYLVPFKCATSGLMSTFRRVGCSVLPKIVTAHWQPPNAADHAPGRLAGGMKATDRPETGHFSCRELSTEALNLSPDTLKLFNKHHNFLKDALFPAQILRV